MRRLSAVLFLCMFAAQAAFLVLGPLLPDLAREFGTTTAVAGQLRTVSGVAGGIAALALATAWRSIPLRRLLSGGLWLIGAAAVAAAAAPNVAILAAAQVVTGAGIAAVLSGGVAAAVAWAAPAQRSRVLAWAIVGQPASWVVGMPVVGAVADASWRAAFLALPLAASVIALAALSTLPSTHAAAPAAGERPSYDRGLLGWALGELLAYAGWSGTLVFAGALLLESYDASTGLTGLLLGAAAAAYFPGAFLARRWVDRHSGRLLAGLGAVLAGGVAVFGLVRPALWASAGLFALLVFAAGGRTLAGAAHRVGAAGLRTAAAQFGSLIGVAAGGAALSAGGYGALGVVLGTLFLLAAAPHAIALGASAARVTAKSSPRGANASPEPATRSRTVGDTSTSPAAA